MAFFGLTMLGPQDPWKVNPSPPPPSPHNFSTPEFETLNPFPQVPKFPDVSTVAKDDFLAAFRRVAGGAGCIQLAQVR